MGELAPDVSVSNHSEEHDHEHSEKAESGAEISSCDAKSLVEAGLVDSHGSHAPVEEKSKKPKYSEAAKKISQYWLARMRFTRVLRVQT